MGGLPKPGPLVYVACYALYLVVLGLGYGSFVIWQQTGLLLVGLVLGNSPALAVADGTFVLVIGMGLFVVALLAEPYLRAGARRRQLGRRFVRLVAPLGVLLGLGALLQELVYALS